MAAFGIGMIVRALYGRLQIKIIGFRRYRKMLSEIRETLQHEDVTYASAIEHNLSGICTKVA